MLITSTIVTLSYYAMTLFFGLAILRNLRKSIEPQEIILYTVVLVPFVLRLFRLK